MAIGTKFNDSLQEQLKDEEVAFEYLREAFEEPYEDGDDIGFLMCAIGDVAKAHGIDNIQAQTGLARSAIYKMLKEDSNPSFKNISKILHVIGLKFNIEPIKKNEKPANVLDVASYILSHSTKSANKETTFWLQKLVYYSQVMSLINHKVPLFEEKIEAWANGPVVRELYNKHPKKLYLKYLPADEIGDETKLSKRHKQCIDWALDKYGHGTGEMLSELTHLEKPWNDARGNLPFDAGSTNQITNEMILDYYLNRPNYSEIEEGEADYS